MKENAIKQIYDLLGDDVSKNIFENRLMYSLTGDMKFIKNVVCTIRKGREIYGCMKERSEIGIFGAGVVGRHLARVYKDVVFCYFIDNKCSGVICEGIPVVSLQEFMEKCPEGTIIISTKLYYEEIVDQLLKEGVRKENVINLGMEYEKLNHLQYFDLPQLNKKKTKREIFVDGGCYDGNSSVDFMKWCQLGGVEGYCYAWEPDPENLKKCKQSFEENCVQYELIPVTVQHPL